MRNRWPLHLLLLCLFTSAVDLFFLQEPGFGDDLTYWTFGYDLHETGLRAWSVQSFHDLRWPVWGVCWVLQGLGLAGIAAYSGVALIYITAGSAVSFTFGRLISRSIPFAWACGLAFFFCPLLDTLCHRPMPDMSEGVWGGLTLLAWWALMHTESRRASIGWAALVGLGVFISESNRLTGSFIVPVLIVATLLFARRRFLWLVLAGCFAVLFYAGEMTWYHWLFRDTPVYAGQGKKAAGALEELHRGHWLHNLDANMNGKDNKGTGNIPFITSPFRFLDSLWKVGRLSPVYCVFAVFGLAALATRRWRRRPESEVTGESGVAINASSLIAVWFIVLYLEYACGPQSFHPWKPIVRDASRFLASLAIPFSIIGVIGLHWLTSVPWVRARRWGRWVPEHPFAVGFVALAALVALTSRPFFDLGFLGDMRGYVTKVPDGTKIFTHHMMRSLAIMADQSSAKRLVWTAGSANREIMNANPLNEQQAAAADEFWYMHKIVWMNNRKRMEKIDKESGQKEVKTQPPFSSYFDQPDRDWALAKLLVKGDSPDIAFYRRRTDAMPQPVPIALDTPEFTNLLPTFPATWVAQKERSQHYKWNIPAALRNKVVELSTVAFANEVEAGAISFRFEPTSRGRREILLKPYTYPTPGRDFFLIPIPADAERCNIQIRYSKETKQATVNELKAWIISPLDGLSPMRIRPGEEKESKDDKKKDKDTESE